METQTQNVAVTKTVTVKASKERAFRVFTEQFFSWWPASHHIGDAELANAVIEPRTGGRWYEVGTDGVECDWGSVLAYEPSDRVLLSWHLQGDWSYHPDPAKASEIEVRFIEEGERTLVELEHRHIERHDDPAEVRKGVDSPGGWAGIMAGYANLFAAGESA
jgi:uncharacterized protein YndB with AHSA1/START domain